MSKIPETDSDVNNFMFTNLKIDNDTNFQLLHNDVNECYNFQIYGCFYGKKVNETFFELEKIEFKLVHINVPNGEPYYKVESVIMQSSSESDNDVDVYIKIREVKKEHKGIDCTLTLNPKFKIGLNDLIDYHVRKNDIEPLNRNGRPCKNRIFF